MRLDVVRQPLMAAFVTLLAVATAGLLCAGAPMLTPTGVATPASLLGGFILQAQQAWPLITKVLCGAAVFFVGASLGRTTIRYALYPIHTYLAIPLYGFLACGIFVSENFSIEYLSATLLWLALHNFYTGFRSGFYGFGEVFRGSLFLGLLLLIYTPGIILAIVVPVAAVVFKRSMREFLVAMVGYVLPLLVVSYLNWCLGGSFSAPFEVISEAIVTPSGFSLLALPLPTQILLGIVFLLYLCSVVCHLTDLYSAGSKSRSIVLFNLLLSPLCGAMCFLPSSGPEIAALVAAPAAIALPLFLVRLKHWASLLVYVGLSALCLVQLCL